jgi:hypothetical protein
MTTYKIRLTGVVGEDLKVVKDDTFTTIPNIFNVRPSTTIDLGILPPIVRSITRALAEEGVSREQSHMVVVERKPELKTVQYKNKYFDKYGAAYRIQNHTFTIPIPWQHYFLLIGKSSWSSMRAENMGMYFSRGPIDSLDHVFYHPYLPNVFVEGNGDFAIDTSDGEEVKTDNLCLGDYNGVTAKNFAQLFDRIYADFWHNRYFNQEASQLLMYFFAEYKKPTKALLSEINEVVEIADDDYETSRVSRLAFKLMKKLSNIPFGEVMHPDIFKAMSPAFTMADYLKAVEEHQEDEQYNFKALFTEHLKGKTFKEIPKPKLVPIVEKAKVKPWVSKALHQGKDGRWRRADNKFASKAEIEWWTAPIGTMPHPKDDYVTYEQMKNSIDYMKKLPVSFTITSTTGTATTGNSNYTNWI